MTLLVEHICCLLNIPTTTTAHLDLDSSIELDHWLLNQEFSYKCESSVNNRRWIHISNSFLPACSPPQQHPWHFRPYFRSYLISPSCNKTFPDNHLEKCSLRSKTLSKHWALHLRTVPSHSISIPSISVSNHCTTCTSRVIDWVGLLSFASSDVIVTI